MPRSFNHMIAQGTANRIHFNASSRHIESGGKIIVNDFPGKNIDLDRNLSNPSSFHITTWKIRSVNKPPYRSDRKLTRALKTPRPPIFRVTKRATIEAY
ncbi:hypothetical protein Tco_0985051 [Tanacetum coccineum]